MIGIQDPDLSIYLIRIHQASVDSQQRHAHGFHSLHKKGLQLSSAAMS